ncbi:hypothetical protein [Chengkuizengella marina]|uniref:Tetratricopeptide repeat-containing protein n=1 Tax=Chengkuizengella marina TaxID=2507566 RepID=A0A6N9Q4P6_9BACL|nr:hypothetical protein [Chengkuizengella marina]NBI29806.1 hypothetical protein [Chengkuizengella marina]
MHKKIVMILVAFVILTISYAVYDFLKPYELPNVDADLSKNDLSLNFENERTSYQKYANETSESQNLHNEKQYQMVVEKLKQHIKEDQENLFYLNELRIVMNNNGEIQKYIDYINEMKYTSKEALLQLALAYIDKLQELNLGTGSLGKLSTLSIRELNKIIENDEYHWLAHYARGLNNLYWPLGLKRIDKAIQDLSYCLSIAKKYKNYENPLWQEIYIAYGDALIKGGEVSTGFQVWKDGYNLYPDNIGLKERVESGEEGAYSIVKKERGIDIFQRPDKRLTDISRLWDQK